MKVKGPDGKVIFFPDSTPPDTIRAVMSRQYGGPGSPPMLSAPGSNTDITGDSQPIDWKGMALGSLPYVGGALGGVAGGTAGGLFTAGMGAPFGAVEGATYGGMIGEKMRRTFAGEPQSASATFGQGALQAATELGGIGASRLIGGVAKGITRRALQPSAAIVEKSPQVAEDVLAAGLQFNRGAKGTEGAAIGSAQAGAQLEDAIRMADSRGVRFNTTDALGDARTFVAKSGAPPSAKRLLQSKLMEIQQGLGPRPTPSALQAAKTYWDDVAASAYGNPDAGLNAKFAKSVAAGMRKQLEKIPGIRQLNSASLRATAASDALSTAVNRNPPPLGASPATWPFLNEAVSPRAQGFLARRLRQGSKLARQTPRAFTAMLKESQNTP
jgi:hypothetical protein